MLNYLTKDEKVYIKVISPNFKLDYNLSVDKIEEKLKEIIRYSDQMTPKKQFLFVKGILLGMILMIF